MFHLGIFVEPSEAVLVAVIVAQLYVKFPRAEQVEANTDDAGFHVIALTFGQSGLQFGRKRFGRFFIVHEFGLLDEHHIDSRIGWSFAC
jgi:hypothetical protein